MLNFTKNLLPIFMVTVLCALGTSASADVGVFPKGQLAKMGYQPAQPQHLATYARIFSKLPPAPMKLLSNETPAPQTLQWPVSFENVSHNLGNSMIQFQQYGSFSAPYWHGGCDLRTAAQSAVRTPVSGQLDAGHYGYETNDDGSMTKQWMPWPRQGDEMYFEVAVIGDDGLRYEFHHIDRATLPAHIKQLLDRGNGRVEAGEVVGHVHSWPMQGADGTYYHHTHYNIVTKDGVRINPESVSLPVEDRRAPDVHGVYALLKSNRVIEVKNGSRLAGAEVQEFVVASTDKNDPNVYFHPPTVVELKAANGVISGWDFRKALLTLDQKFPDIHQVYKEALTTPSGERLRTQGDYNNNFFLTRLVVPAGSKAPFEIKVEDFAGNAQLFEITD